MANEQQTDERLAAYKKLLRDLADEIVGDDLAKLKNEVKGKKGCRKTVLDKINTTQDFFDLLQNTGKLASDKTGYLRNLLPVINRENLCPKIDRYNRIYQGSPRNRKRKPPPGIIDKHTGAPNPGSSSGEVQAEYPGEPTGAPNPSSSSGDVQAKDPDESHGAQNPVTSSGDVQAEHPDWLKLRKKDIKVLTRDVYPIKDKQGVRVVIINNEKFKGQGKDRAGTDKDAVCLKEVFKQLGIDNVDIQMNRTGQQIIETMVKEAKDFKKTDSSFICVILSHGNLDIVYGTDWQTVTISDIYSKFVGDNCKNLIGKPKIFLIQACQGDQRDHGVLAVAPDGLGLSKRNPYLTLPTESDLLVAFATWPGYQSYRNTSHGSLFIKAFIHVLMTKACKEHLADMLTEVNHLVSGYSCTVKGDKKIKTGVKQGCVWVSSFRKRFYFPVL